MPTFGAKIIAQALHDLGVQVIFGLPGLPVIDIAQEGIYLGIRFVAFRNEQASVYAACAYGYLTGKPGVCISVGGPGVLHVMAGIPHAMANAWPLLVLSGASETHNNGKGAFQEMDAIPMITPMAKFAARPPNADRIPKFIKDAYRAAMFGKPGPAYIDLPANLIMSHFDVPRNKLTPLPEAPKSMAPPKKIQAIVNAFKSAKAPLIVMGKGAAYAYAEKPIQELVANTGIPFFPSPMAKGVVPDSSPHNISAARSAAMKDADLVLVLGARLNWVLSFGTPPKWNENVKIIQVDISGDELGKNAGDPELSVVGDVGLVTEQLVEAFGSWKWNGKNTPYYRKLQETKARNEQRAAKKASNNQIPMTYEKVYDVIKKTLDAMSNPKDGDIVYVSEGANAMDIARTVFTMEHPRVRLDAGTYATMGIGLGYAIAAYAAYNFPNPEGKAGAAGRKKIVAIEGDSAFGFSAVEVDTMARHKMDCIIYVMNNSGLYRGDSRTKDDWLQRQKVTTEHRTTEADGFTALTLGYETDYHKIADFAGGEGFVVRTPEELKTATEKAYKSHNPCVINVIIDPQSDLVMDFSWLDMKDPNAVDPAPKQSKL